MRVNGFTCDTCDKLDNTYLVTNQGKLPEAWFVLIESRSDNKKHFCSIDCLYQWTLLTARATNPPIAVIASED